MKILTKLRNSLKRKKKKPIEEKIPDGLQQRIKTPGDRIDCSLEKWSEGEISISSVEQNIPSYIYLFRARFAYWYQIEEWTRSISNSTATNRRSDENPP